MSDEEDLTYEQNYVLTTAGSAGVTWALKEKPKKKTKKNIMYLFRWNGLHCFTL